MNQGDVEMATCPTCGTEEVPGQQFCSSCGSPTSSVYSNPAPLPAYPATAPSSGGSYVLATFWKRFLGYLIDYLILIIIGVLILRPAHASFTAAVIAATALSFLYNSLQIGFNHGQTIGMRIASVKCVDQDGFTEINYPRAVRRAVFYGVLTLLGSLENVHRYTHPTTVQLHHYYHQELILVVLVLPHLVDLLWVAWDKRNQTLHDKFARTVVISTRLPLL
jgi:uncharacterized RDD family membrane protein YckC